MHILRLEPIALERLRQLAPKVHEPVGSAKAALLAFQHSRDGRVQFGVGRPAVVFRLDITAGHSREAPPIALELVSRDRIPPLGSHGYEYRAFTCMSTRVGNTPNVMRREAWLPAAPEGVVRARALVREVAADLRLDAVTTWELMLATSEAFSNAVEHGRPCARGGIRVRVEGLASGVGVEVSDCGSFPTRWSTGKRRGEGGRGMRTIAAIMDQLEVVRTAGATRVRFVKAARARLS